MARTRAASPARARSPPAPKRRGGGGGDKKRTLWARYNTALVQHPFAMNLVQSGVSSVLAGVTQQAIAGKGFDLDPIATALTVTLIVISPIVSVWISLLQRWKLHWAVGTVVDQFAFSPLFNIVIMWSFDLLGGGIEPIAPPPTAWATAAAPLAFGLTLHRSKFSSLRVFEPVWAVQWESYKLFLPATLLREKVVPPHLAMVFITVVSFVWNIIFAFKMAD